MLASRLIRLAWLGLVLGILFAPQPSEAGLTLLGNCAVELVEAKLDHRFMVIQSAGGNGYGFAKQSMDGIDVFPRPEGEKEFPAINVSSKGVCSQKSSDDFKSYKEVVAYLLNQASNRVKGIRAHAFENQDPDQQKANKDFLDSMPVLLEACSEDAPNEVAQLKTMFNATARAKGNKTH